ncbi:Crp/Fnr family transcriptional regulator [Wukongibacter sp. M2B1]|uniref:Crp/Fnr family transcriptional regulator n=1 Tax=Wukongibacter sp. M2B1 TaxID=3088895 RepID=UPI003D798FCF
MNYDALCKCLLFKHCNKDEFQELLSGIEFYIHTYNKGEFVISEEEHNAKIGIILLGAVEVQKVFPTGKMVTLNRLKTSEVFGLSTLFSYDSYYPTSIVSLTRSKVLFLSQKSVIELFNKEPEFLQQFLRFTSDRILFLNRKIEIFSFSTIREKITYFLFSEMKLQKSDQSIILPFAKRVWAEYLNIARTSLYRVLKEMKEEGIIDLKGRSITIKKLDELKKEIL